MAPQYQSWHRTHTTRDDHISQHNCIATTEIHQVAHQLLPKLALLCCLDIFTQRQYFFLVVDELLMNGVKQQ